MNETLFIRKNFVRKSRSERYSRGEATAIVFVNKNVIYHEIVFSKEDQIIVKYSAN